MRTNLTTNARIVYSIVTQLYMFESKDKSFFFETRTGKVLDNFNMDTDPIDLVADQITEAIIEMATYPIDTDEQVIQISQEVYCIVSMFYSMNDMVKDRQMTFHPENQNK